MGTRAFFSPPAERASSRGFGRMLPAIRCDVSRGARCAKRQIRCRHALVLRSCLVGGAFLLRLFLSSRMSAKGTSCLLGSVFAVRALLRVIV